MVGADLLNECETIYARHFNIDEEQRISSAVCGSQPFLSR
jgi:hypothetical protein